MSQDPNHPHNQGYNPYSNDDYLDQEPDPYSQYNYTNAPPVPHIHHGSSVPSTTTPLPANPTPAQLVHEQPFDFQQYPPAPVAQQHHPGDQVPLHAGYDQQYTGYDPSHYSDDQQYYDPPGVVPSNPYQSQYSTQNHNVPSQYTVPPPETNMPQPGFNPAEDPNSYLLKPWVQPQHHVLGMNHSNDSFSYDNDIDNFQPFPIAGDQYALNTYEDDESEEEEDSEEDDDSILPDHTAVPPVPDYQYTSQPFADPSILPVPQEGMQLRRSKTMKKVRLYRGNLVLDCPVSKKLLSQLPEPRMEREFTHMRYSAATCDPKEFVSRNFTLRQTCYQQPRETELFIVVTMYNEDDILLGRTLQGVFKNIKNLTTRTRSKTWGKDAWKKVVVCVVSDGREKINARAKALMSSLGVYQDGFAKNIVNDLPVQAHIYEYTTMVGISNVDKTVKLTCDRTIPVQMIFCLKEKNQKKINSHRWFFQAFGPILNPRVCILLDAGTQPGGDSIYHLWKSFDMHPRVAGACGEIEAMLGPGGRMLLNPLVAAQNFEYKMSNILDKPLESVFGFISVLPGAFSAYRYVALQNDVNGRGPLEKYFKGETLEAGSGIFTANMYLAEDRILCFELVAKRNAAWVLKYVKSAHAHTDVPDRLAELVLQRRRWLNGSFFAAIYSLAHAFSIWRSSHSIGRKLALHVEFFYQFVSMLFSWFSIGNFFLVFRILTSSLSDPALGFAPGKILSVVLLWIYVGCIVTIFVLSFGNKPMGTHIFYIIIVAFFALLMAYLLFAAIFVSVKAVEYTLCVNGDHLTFALVFGTPTFRDLIVSLLSTYALYFISSFLFFEPWHMFTSFLQYLLLSPSYINVLNVYAFCNIHDISWGTKGDTEQKFDLGVAKTNQAGKLEVDIPTHVEDIDASYMQQISTLAKVEKPEPPQISQSDKDRDYYALFRSSVVLIWMFTNFVIIAVVLNTAGLNTISSDTSTDTSSTAAVGLKRGLSAAQDLLIRQTTGSCGALGSSGGVRTEIYLSVVLWVVAALAAFRFIGAVWYLITRLIGH